MKKKAAIFLALIMVLSMLPMNVFGSGHVLDPAEAHSDARRSFDVRFNIADFINLNTHTTDAAFRLVFNLSEGQTDFDATTFTVINTDLIDSVGSASPIDPQVIAQAGSGVNATREVFLGFDETELDNNILIPAGTRGTFDIQMTNVRANNANSHLTVRLYDWVPAPALPAGGQWRFVRNVVDSPLILAAAAGVNVSAASQVNFDEIAALGGINIDERRVGDLNGQISILLRAPRGYTWSLDGIGVLGVGQARASLRFGSLWNFDNDAFEAAQTANVDFIDVYRLGLGSGQRDDLLVRVDVQRATGLAATLLNRLTLSGFSLVPGTDASRTGNIAIDVYVNVGHPVSTAFGAGSGWYERDGSTLNSALTGTSTPMFIEHNNGETNAANWRNRGLQVGTRAPISIWVSPNHLALDRANPPAITTLAPGDSVEVAVREWDASGNFMHGRAFANWQATGLAPGDELQITPGGVGHNATVRQRQRLIIGNDPTPRTITLTATLVSDPEISAYYTVRVNPDAPGIRILPPENNLVSGVPAQAVFPVEVLNIPDGVHQVTLHGYGGFHEGLLTPIGFTRQVGYWTGNLTITGGRGNVVVAYNGMSNLPPREFWTEYGLTLTLSPPSPHGDGGSGTRRDFDVRFYIADFLNLNTHTTDAAFRLVFNLSEGQTDFDASTFTVINHDLIDSIGNVSPIDPVVIAQAGSGVNATREVFLGFDQAELDNGVLIPAGTRGTFDIRMTDVRANDANSHLTVRLYDWVTAPALPAGGQWRFVRNVVDSPLVLGDTGYVFVRSNRWAWFEPTVQMRVGNQVGQIYAGDSGTVYFPITTVGVADGVHEIHIHDWDHENAWEWLQIQGVRFPYEVEIRNGQGRLVVEIDSTAESGWWGFCMDLEIDVGTGTPMVLSWTNALFIDWRPVSDGLYVGDTNPIVIHQESENDIPVRSLLPAGEYEIFVFNLPEGFVTRSSQGVTGNPHDVPHRLIIGSDGTGTLRLSALGTARLGIHENLYLHLWSESTGHFAWSAPFRINVVPNMGNQNGGNQEHWDENQNQDPVINLPSVFVRGNDDIQIGIRQVNDEAHLRMPSYVVNQLIDTAEDNTVVIDLTSLDGVSEVNMPITALHRLAESGLSVQVQFGQGTITLDTEALQYMTREGRGANLLFSLISLALGDLTEAQQAALGGEDAYRVLAASSGGGNISQFDGLMTVSVPFDGENPEVARLAEDGTRELVESAFDGETVTFSTNRLSVFIIGSAEAAPLGLLPLHTMRFSIGSTIYTLHGTPHFSDAAPFIEQDRTMVPVRVIAYGLGAASDDIIWNEATQTVTITLGDWVVSLTIGVPLPNGMGTPVIRYDRTFVPLRYVSEVLGADVRWDGVNNAVYIYR